MAGAQLLREQLAHHVVGPAPLRARHKPSKAQAQQGENRERLPIMTYADHEPTEPRPRPEATAWDLLEARFAGFTNVFDTHAARWSRADAEPAL